MVVRAISLAATGRIGLRRSIKKSEIETLKVIKNNTNWPALVKKNMDRLRYIDNEEPVLVFQERGVVIKRK